MEATFTHKGTNYTAFDNGNDIILYADDCIGDNDLILECAMPLLLSCAKDELEDQKLNTSADSVRDHAADMLHLYCIANFHRAVLTN